MRSLPTLNIKGCPTATRAKGKAGRTRATGRLLPVL